jgi:hypothetical protein
MCRYEGIDYQHINPVIDHFLDKRFHHGFADASAFSCILQHDEVLIATGINEKILIHNVGINAAKFRCRRKSSFDFIGWAFKVDIPHPAWSRHGTPENWLTTNHCQSVADYQCRFSAASYAERKRRE